jgi:hypothetical protein
VVITGVIFAQQSDIARDARCDDRRAGDYRLRDGVRPAFQAGGIDSQLAAHQELSHAPLRLLADPVIAWIDLHLAAGAFGHLFVRRAAGVDDSDARCRVQHTSRHRRAEWVFDFAQTPDDADSEIADRGSGIADFREWFDRLIDDSCFGVEMFRQFFERFGLKNYQPRREFE